MLFQKQQDKNKEMIERDSNDAKERLDHSRCAATAGFNTILHIAKTKRLTSLEQVLLQRNSKDTCAPNLTVLAAGKQIP